MADPVVQQITQSQTTIPEYARPYVENLLGTTAGTVYQYQRDASGNIVKDESGQPIISGLQPYMQYQGDRVAQFAPLQQQAYGAAQYLAPAGQLGAATDIATTAGLGALGTQYDPSRFRSRSFNAPGTAAGYMSPYMQNVVDVQQREAKRQADIAATARGAQAARAGAFGGSRQAIESAEANRNLQRQLGDIQATGLQSAYNQAQQQFNAEQAARQAAAQLREQSRQFGAGLGMQGLQTGLQAAGQLGNIGQQQFGQEQQAIQTQAGLGQQQQQRMQDILNTQYQDFLNFQNYPYKQLGFMSDMLRGLPLTQQSGTIYGPQPSAVQNLASLGLGAYGISSLFGKAEGGAVKSYADGGSVMSQYNKDKIVGDLHPMGLPRALQGAMMRGDMETAQSAQDEMALDAAIRRGIAAAAPYDIGVGYADGGIVAFAGGGAPVQRYKEKGYVRVPGSDMLVHESDFEDEDGETRPEQYSYLGAADPGILSRAERDIEAVSGFVPTAVDPTQVEAVRKARLDAIDKELGEGPYGAFGRSLTERDAARGQALEQGKGLAALRAAAAVLAPGGTMRGLGAAGSAFAESYGKALEADRAEKQSIAAAQFHLADAQRKERMGLMKEADAAEAAYRGSVKDANKFSFDKLKAQADARVKLAQASRQLRAPGAGAGRGPKEFEFAMDQYLPDIQDRYPDLTPAQQRAKAFQTYQERRGAGLPGVQAKVEATAEEKARERAAKRYTTDQELNTALREKDAKAAAKRRQEILREELDAPASKAGAGQTGGVTPEAFSAKWATLKSGESLVGPDGKVYIKQ